MAKHPHATPAQLRLWADEVRYLHSLWHRVGPTNPNPATAVASSSRPSFKKKKTIIQPPAEEEDPANNPWLRPPSSPPKTGWGESRPPAGPPKTAATNSINKCKPEEPAMQASVSVDKAHQAALRACEIFFYRRAASPSYPDSGREDYHEEDEDDGYESEVFDFLLGVFERDAELRGYYEKNWEKGEFSCLVCAAVGAKVGRRYAGCVGLVQHASAISKTKRPLAHRSLANVVCRVLGWDTSRLPSIVLDPAKPLGKTVEETAEQKDDLNGEEINKEKEEINNQITDSTSEIAAIVDNEMVLSDNGELQERNDDDDDADDDNDDDDDGCGEVDWDLI